MLRLWTIGLSLALLPICSAAAWPTEELFGSALVAEKPCPQNQLSFDAKCREVSYFESFVTLGEELLGVFGCRDKLGCGGVVVVQTRAATGWTYLPHALLSGTQAAEILCCPWHHLAV